MQTAAITERRSGKRCRPYSRCRADSAIGDARVAAAFKAAFAGFDTLDLIASDSAGRRTSVGRRDQLRASTFRRARSRRRPSRAAERGERHGPAVTRPVGRRRSAGRSTTRSPASLSAVVPVIGQIYGYLEQNGLQSDLINACCSTTTTISIRAPRTTHLAYRCLEKLVDGDAKSPLVYSELAALHLEAVTDHYAYPAGATDEQAMALARRAVQMGPTSPMPTAPSASSIRALAIPRKSIRWMRKAYELNTYDLSMAAAYGYALVFAGDYREGAPILQRAVEASSAHPTWWDYGLFLGSFMLDDMDRAARATEALVTAKRSHIWRRALSRPRPQEERLAVTQLLRELTYKFPKFATDPAAVFRNAYYPEDLTEKFVECIAHRRIGPCQLRLLADPNSDSKQRQLRQRPRFTTS